MADSQALRKVRYADKFRGYQGQAIAMARKYRRSFHDEDGAQGLDAALVYHPTGTGKTAVIAGLTHAAHEIGNVLVLTTREVIRDQLVRELSGGLFIDENKFALPMRHKLSKVCFAVAESRQLLGTALALHAATRKRIPDQVVREFSQRQFERLAPEPDIDIVSHLHEQNSVLILTVQMLARLHRGRTGQSPIYDVLRQHVDLVVFDEGHYEPAPRYSEAVRDLGRPTVLLTATPFRNDLKAFRITPEHVDIYRFTQAVQQQHIREVQIVQRTPTRDPDKFCADVLDFCTSVWGPDPGQWTRRIIIRCDDVECVTRLGEAFIAHGFKDRVIGIHDRYTNPGQGDGQPWQYRTVPAPSETQALVWIHQHKLLEGVDDHRFQILAFFNPPTNVRAIVQQIGRVVRTKPGGQDAGNAYVLDYFAGRIARYWSLYRGYDAAATPEAVTMTASRFYLTRFTAALPQFDYIDQKFRQRLDLFDHDQQAQLTDTIADEIFFKRTVALRQIPNTLTIQDVVPLLEIALKEGDYEYQRFDVSKICPNTALFLCSRVNNVDFLNTYFFPEPHLEARLVMLFPEHALLASTSTAGASVKDGLGILARYDPTRLERLLLPGNDNRGRITNVSSKNMNLSSRAVRGRVVYAASMADIPAALDEHGHVVSTVTGYNGSAPQVIDHLEYQVSVLADELARSGATTEGPGTGATLVRRYVGIASGHVTEYLPPLRIKAFRTWVQSLANQMDDPARYDRVFSRYAELAVGETVSGAAQNLLLDFTELTELYRHRLTGQCVISDDVCADRLGDPYGTPEQPAAQFIMTINDTPYTIAATFNTSSKRYRIECPALDYDFIPIDDRDGSLIRAINQMQAFTVVPEDRDRIYAHGSFYAPSLKFGPDRFNPNGFPIGHLLYPSQQFKSKETEKGDKVIGGNRYQTHSLFGLIDSWKSGFDTAELDLDPHWVRRSGYVPESLSFSPTALIVDDMGCECADFIIADTLGRRVVLIHGKASETWRPYSASALQEICAQAQKNTALFSSREPRMPPNITLWDKAHNFNNLSVAKRIRKPNRDTAERIWHDQLAPLLANPLTSREIWLVLGNMLSASEIIAQLKTDRPAAEVLQLTQLLHTTMEAARGVAANLRIFCSP